jgi:peptidoglycan hydrolase CwlO-like protein
MEQTLINEAVKSGMWALLFVVLLIYTIRENKSRELEYQRTIGRLNDEIKTTACDSNRVVKDTSEDVDILDKKVNTISQKVDVIDRKIDHLNEKTDALNRRLPDSF